MSETSTTPNSHLKTFSDLTTNNQATYEHSVHYQQQQIQQIQQQQQHDNEHDDAVVVVDSLHEISLNSGEPSTIKTPLSKNNEMITLLQSSLSLPPTVTLLSSSSSSSLSTKTETIEDKISTVKLESSTSTSRPLLSLPLLSQPLLSLSSSPTPTSSSPTPTPTPTSSSSNIDLKNNKEEFEKSQVEKRKKKTTKRQVSKKKRKKEQQKQQQQQQEKEEDDDEEEDVYTCSKKKKLIRKYDINNCFICQKYDPKKSLLACMNWGIAEHDCGVMYCNLCLKKTFDCDFEIMSRIKKFKCAGCLKTDDLKLHYRKQIDKQFRRMLREKGLQQEQEKRQNASNVGIGSVASMNRALDKIRPHAVVVDVEQEIPLMKKKKK